MSVKSLVPIRSDQDEAAVRGSDEQNRAVEATGHHPAPIRERPVLVTGNSFPFDDAVRAQEAVRARPPAGRTAYYLPRLVGPPAPRWLRALRGVGAGIHDSLSGSTLLVGVLPERVDRLRAMPRVEDVTPYRPTTKVSPSLRAGGRAAGVAELSTLDPAGGAELVEVSVFPGESGQEVAARVRRSGGTVLTVTARTLVAHVDPSGPADLPGDEHPCPRTTNNVRRVVVDTPEAGAHLVRVWGVSVVAAPPTAPRGTGPRQPFAPAVANGDAPTGHHRQERG